MTANDTLEKLLKSYGFYYDIKTDGVLSPFVAEAAFHSHDEQYFLVKSAKLTEADSHEYVFFAVSAQLDAETVQKLDAAAWTEGLSRVKPHSAHRNTDITLVILAEKISPEAFALIKKLRHYESYKWGFQGWSNYRVIAMETDSGRLTFNRMGQSLKKLFRNIYYSEEGELS